MIALTDFEGVNGFRWGALIGGDGRLETHGRVPDQAGKRVGVIARVLQQGPFTFDGSDLVFDTGKVLVRRGAFGLLMLFMDDRVNISIVNALLLQDAEANRAGSSSASTDSHLGEVGSMSMVHSVSLDAKPVPAEIIEELLDIYTRFLGPLARKLAAKRTEAEHIDLARVTTRDWSKLLNVLAARITDEAKHEDFLDQAVLLKTRF